MLLIKRYVTHPPTHPPNQRLYSKEQQFRALNAVEEDVSIKVMVERIEREIHSPTHPYRGERRRESPSTHMTPVAHSNRLVVLFHPPIPHRVQ